MSNGLELRKGMYKEAFLPRHSGKEEKDDEAKDNLGSPQSRKSADHVKLYKREFT